MQVTSPPVLYFHSVAPRPFAGWPLRFLTMRLDRFEQQMHYLHKRGYRAIFLEEWLAMRRGELPTDEKAVCLTFDDGLLDNWVYAFPIAKKYGMRMTLFVCPDSLNQAITFGPTLKMYGQGVAILQRSRASANCPGANYARCRNRVMPTSSRTP